MDYSNSDKSKEEKDKPAEKKIEKIITGEVVVQKKSFGRKFRDTFVEADFRSVLRYVVSDVLVPAAKNMIVDGTYSAVQRFMYGESAMRRRGVSSGGSHIAYNRPVERGYRGGDPIGRSAPAISSGPRGRRGQEEYILSSREEADAVIEAMNDIISQFQAVSIADLNELIGISGSTHIDNKWGWEVLGTVPVRLMRDGYLLDLPPAEPL